MAGYLPRLISSGGTNSEKAVGAMRKSWVILMEEYSPVVAA